VQGVSFRAYAVRAARSFGIRGFVRNLWNGDVEIVAVGERDGLDRLIAWAREGPPSARVDDVVVEFEPPSLERSDFRIEF
jgi:acylphosphatase